MTPGAARPILDGEMRAVRRHLRAGVAAWLVCHALTFSALLPRDCCAAHAHAAHAAAPTPDDASGNPCPMHHAPAPAQDDCRLAGACNAPAAALSAVLLQSGTPPAPLCLLPDVWTPRVRSIPSAERPLALSAPPDPPPPRA